MAFGADKNQWKKWVDDMTEKRVKKLPGQGPTDAELDFLSKMFGT